LVSSLAAEVLAAANGLLLGVAMVAGFAVAGGLAAGPLDEFSPVAILLAVGLEVAGRATPVDFASPSANLAADPYLVSGFATLLEFNPVLEAEAYKVFGLSATALFTPILLTGLAAGFVSGSFACYTSKLSTNSCI